METNITLRFPRPMGITALSVDYQNNPTDESLIKLYNYFVNNWFMNNGTICGKPYDTNQLTMVFHIPPVVIKNFMKDSVLSSKVFNLSTDQDMVESLMGEQLKWVLEDRMEAAQQVNLLRASQGSKYTPFVSAELNKALKLKQDSATAMGNVIRTITGGSSVNIFTQINQQTNQQVNQGITIEEARELIQESQKVLPKSEEAKLLEAKYDMGELPEVVAVKQTGVDTSKEGLNLNKVELNAITDDYQGALKVSSHEHHEQRREIEERIDPYEEDPELVIYDEYTDDDSTDSSVFGISSMYLNK